MCPSLRVISLCLLIVGHISITTTLTVESHDINNVTSDIGIHYEKFHSCLTDSNLCVRAVEDLLEQNDTIQLTDSVAIEMVDNVTSDEVAQETTSDVEEGRAEYMGEAIENIVKLLKSRSLKINLLDLVTVRMAKSKEQPGSLEVIFESVPEEGRGRVHRMGKVIIPLVLGFKLTGALIFAISTVKIFLLKAFVLSKLALLTAIYMVVKKMLSAVGIHHHPYLFTKTHLPPYFHGGMEPSIPADYGYNPYHAGYGTQYTSPHDYNQYAAAGGGHGDGGGVGADDLQAHYSNTNAAVAPTSRNGTRITARTDVPVRGVIGLVKSSANRVPVNTYRKLVNTGRSADAKK